MQRSNRSSTNLSYRYQIKNYICFSPSSFLMLHVCLSVSMPISFSTAPDSGIRILWVITKLSKLGNIRRICVVFALAVFHSDLHLPISYLPLDNYSRLASAYCIFPSALFVSSAHISRIL